MVKNISIFVLFLCLSSIALQTKAQSFGEKSFVGLSAGVAKYSGSMPETQAKSAFSINFTYQITDKFHIQFQAMASEAGGSDSALNNLANNGNDARASGYYFRTNINEFLLMPEYDIFNLNEGRKFTPYVFGGIGFYNFKPYQIVQTTRPNGTVRNENLAMTQVESFSNWQMNVPVGIGFRYAVSPNVILNAEGNYRFLFNPYLDNYIADNKNDKYYTVSVGIAFRLSPIAAASKGFRGKEKDCKCPPVY